MATTKCARCDSTSFEAKVFEPRGSNYKLVSVQCASCGAAIGVMEYMNSTTQIQKLEKQLQDVAADVDRIRRLLQNQR